MIQIELKNKVKEPRITLVGAGPGDADLITIKGIKALKTADVVLYDALVNEELLEFAPEHAVKVYVGKRSGDHSFSQGNINKLMIDYAINYGHVVRLKGGDPFVFGRGYEELDFAASYSIPATVIPGISSAISVPGLQQIPVTHRGLSESFWVVTGTTSDGKVSKDLFEAARTFLPEVHLLASEYKGINIVNKSFEEADLDNANLVIAATNDAELNELIVQAAHERNLLVNIADKPALCDFYLGSIVQKGDLKLAISTNGKSPTVAKRLKEVLNESIPAEIDTTLQQIAELRKTLSGDFASKVKKLNEVTAVLVEKSN